MSGGVDDRIVSMKFDNVAFEKRLSDTIKSLDNLRTSLDFANSTKGFENITAAANSVNLGSIASATDAIAGKFNAMTVIATAAITRLTHMAVDQAVKIVKAFTFQPIKDGFQEFETNMNSIQTILANTDSKGTTLPQVNAALDQLNQYSDKTIYNFSQMARNIGTFTAAGIDLDTSVSAIKGIANVAAVSGSNADQASTAMYQLSQALAAGSVKLMDWNSVVNAGMGGEVFQKALFETGKKMGTIADVNMSTTFDQWKESGNSFRLSLEQGWLTGEVLTETLAGFTGDLTEAQIMAKGYTKEQATEILRMGKIASAAATEVKTLTQLVGTVKESVGSGWSSTFRLVIGDFEESKDLFTSINNAIGGFVSRSADARNEMLSEWKAFGGRTALIEAFKNIFETVGNVVRQVSDALREFFPKTTSADLLEMTARFSDFTEKIKLGDGALENISEIFRGFFSTLKIGWEVIKGLAGVVGDLFGALFSGGGDAFTDIARGAGSLADFNAKVLESGAIPKFFERVGDTVRDAVKHIKDFIGFFAGIFTGFTGSEEVADSLKRVNSRMGNLRDTAGGFADAWQKMADRLKGIRKVLDDVWDYTATWFRELGSKLAAVMQPGDFDAAVDIVNVGLLGGIVVLLKKFLNGGLKVNLGDGLIDTIKGSFDQLTGTLKAMQADLKAKALLKIAGAVGILTVSMVALSLIDSEALAKALVAIGIGFGQLVTVMVLMDKFGGAAVKTNAMATSMILMATAVGILSIAVTNLSQLDSGELARGLIGVAGGLGIMIVAMKLMGSDPGGSIAAGVAMTTMAISLLVLAEAVKAFADMEWESMAQGLVGIAVALGIVVVAMNFMPVASTLAAGAAMIPLAIGIRILGEAVEKFAGMSWSEMGKGLLGVAGSLAIIAATMSFMPVTLPITAAGVLILSGALLVMAEAIKNMAAIKFGDMAKAVGGLGVMLAILVVAMNLMSGALPGAAALVIVGGALVILTQVLKELSKLSIAELAMGLGAMAAVFLVLGGASYLLAPLVPTLMGLGIAVGIVGVAFALFGAGAMMLGKAFELVSKSGAKGAEAIVDILGVLLSARVKIVHALVGAIIDFAKEILNAAPLIIKSIKVILGHILDTIIELVPKLAKAISTLIDEAIKLIRDKVPDIIALGAFLILSYLKGIRDNIGEIVSVAAEIVTNFLDALTEKVPAIVDSAYDLIFTVLTTVAEKLGRGLPTLYFSVAESLLGGLIQGLKDTFPKVLSWFKELPAKILDLVKSLLGINSPSTKFLEIGVNIVTGLFNGLVNTIGTVTTWFTQLPGKIIGWVGDVTKTLWEKGVNFVGGLVGGFTSKVADISTWYISLPGKILGWIGNVLSTLKPKGVDLISGLFTGIKDTAETARIWLSNLGLKIWDWIGDLSKTLLNVGKDIMDGLWDGLKEKWEDVKGWLSKLNPATWFNDINPYKGHAVKNLVSTGSAVIAGLWNGMKDGWDEVKKWLKTIDPSENISDVSTKGINATFDEIISHLKDLDDLSPTITPVLDLTRVRAASRAIGDLVSVSALVPEVSLDRARTISTTTEMARAAAATQEPTNTGPSEINFTQINNSPTPLSTNDIYRNTKSQIAMAKEELEIT